MKILTVVGARPQFIKAAVVQRGLRALDIEEIMIHTGQHYDEEMSEVFFRQLGISLPAINLGVGSGRHGAQTGQMLKGVECVLIEENPAGVIVYGDTNTTLAGALAAAKLNVPVAHVEAGLRSGNRRMPEETNRVLTDYCSDVLFAPTEKAVQNLHSEGFDGDRIELVGDVMYDAVLQFSDEWNDRSGVPTNLNVERNEYVLVTIHRAENTDDAERLLAILEGLNAIARELMPVLFPVHPRTADRLRELDTAWQPEEDFRMIDPVGYLDMLKLERHAAGIATDSGGVQKEAFFHEVPCATLRDETEWSELAELGWNTVVPPVTPERVFQGVKAVLGTFGVRASPYGDGTAGRRIAENLYHRWGGA